MKKLLSLLASFGLITTTSITAISCSSKPEIKDLSNFTAEDLILNPETDEQEDVESAAIDKINQVLSISVKKGVDFTVEFKKANILKDGYLIVQSTPSSQTISGQVTFNVKYVGDPALQDIQDQISSIGNNTMRVSVSKDGDSRTLLKASVGEGSSDFIDNVVVDNSTIKENKFGVSYNAKKAGTATIVLSYRKITKEVKIIINKNDLGIIGGSSLILNPLFNTQNAASETFAKNISKKVGHNIDTTSDFKVTSFKEPTSDSNGSLGIEALSTSNYIQGSALFSINFKTVATIKNPGDDLYGWLGSSMSFDLSMENANGVTIPTVTLDSDSVGQISDIVVSPTEDINKFVVNYVGTKEGDASITISYGENKEKLKTKITIKEDKRVDISTLSGEQLVLYPTSAYDSTVSKFIVDTLNKYFPDKKISSDDLDIKNDLPKINDLGDVSDGTSTVTSVERSELVKGSVKFTVKYPVKDISQVFTSSKSQLGPILFDGDKPDKEQLMKAINKKLGFIGPKFYINSFDIIKQDATSATITGKNSLKGEATVTYSKANPIDLNQIKSKDLGEIKGATENVKINMIVSKIKQIDPDQFGKISTSDVEFANPDEVTNTKAVIRAKKDSILAKGQVELTFNYIRN
ncbi:hypothetical protein SHELI_v1c10530 [Spiroplasma helicoides]|uniref:Lipoprotein n=1 Tax=Spiroplasma helicoides TaxID=216938 RepID=A0A1B3SM62_9MOLU|nr:lipoprotein [Spiroplasma helicoides]AOG61000.1 hypothetical protein SHELI_v1c10530 [Spiroplasma helicoides]